MTFLPIVERELRVAARRRATYWIRLGVALVGLLIGGWILLVLHLRSRELGLALFVGLAVVSLLYSGFAGVLSTADSLSAEKREGTLGLLFLTDLKAYNVVLGKLAAKSLNTFYGMLAIFPVMAIPLLAGGVSGAEFWRVVLVCVNNLFFSMSLGMFCSALCRDERKAVVLAVVTLLFFAAGLPILAALLFRWLHSDAIVAACLIPSPGYASALAFDEIYRSIRAQNFFATSVIVLHSVSWMLLGLTTLVVPRAWQDKETHSRPTGFWHWLKHRSAEHRAAVRERMLARNPFYWLAGRDPLKPLLVWLMLGLGGLIWLIGVLIDPREWLYEGPCAITAYLVHTVLKFWVAFEACRQLAGDRRSGALELLLVTPIAARQILWGQVRALVKQFGLPVLVMVAVDVLCWNVASRDREWRLFMGSITLLFVADLVALTCVGMWQALRSRNVNRAVGATIVRILILPWIVYAMALTAWILAGSSMWIRLPLPHGPLPVLLVGLAIALIINVLFAWPAWAHLKAHLRTAVTGHQPKQAP